MHVLFKRLPRPIQEYPGVFPEKDSQALHPNRGIILQIDLELKAVLPNRPTYWTNLVETDEFQKQITKLVKKSYIGERPSPCAVSDLFMPTKDGSWKMSMDCRSDNTATDQHRQHIPRLDEMLEEHGSQKSFNLNLKSGFYQVRIEEEGKWKTVFKIEHGLYEWLVMLFGLTKATSSLMCLNLVTRALTKKSPKIWKENLLHVGVAYIYAKHLATKFSTSEVDYGKNPTSPVPLIQLPISDRASFCGQQKAEQDKKFHKPARENFQRRVEQFVELANKDLATRRFNKNDLEWIRLRKGRLSIERELKLMFYTDGSPSIDEMNDENAYQLDHGKHTGSSFNIHELFSYFAVDQDKSDLRTNPFQEREDDVSTVRRQAEEQLGSKSQPDPEQEMSIRPGIAPGEQQIEAVREVERRYEFDKEVEQRYELDRGDEQINEPDKDKEPNEFDTFEEPKEPDKEAEQKYELDKEADLNFKMIELGDTERPDYSTGPIT